MKVKASILVDLGNSETRMTLLVNGKVRTTTLSNKFAALPSGYNVPIEYNNDKSNVICVNGAYYASGLLAEREFTGQLIRPSSVQMKSEQIITEVTMNMVFITAILQLAEGKGVGVSEIDPTFDIAVLLPPLEHDMRLEQMKELVSKIKSVNPYLPMEFTCTINLETVQVLPEGVAAFFGAYYIEKNGELIEVPENMRFSNGTVLVLDIGAGTTDVLIIKDTELLLNSKDTFTIGGNTVESNLRKLISRKFGFAPNDLGIVVETGLLKDGSISHDVSDLVTSAKDMYSKMLMTNIRTYLERMMLSMREVNGILVVGGGSLPSVRDGDVVSPAMSDVLINYFKELSPNIAVMSIGDKNPRLLNIQGLQYIHKYA